MVVVLMIGLLASFAVAKDLRRTDDETFGKMNRLHGPAFTSRATFEGFEAAVPPAGWSATVNNTDTWEQLALEGGSLEGDFAAYIHWNTTVAQDEAIAFSHTVDVAGDEYVLSFWMAGSRGMEWDLNATETVAVDGTSVFDWDTAPNPGENFVWEKHFIDLTAYDGQTIEISFRYVGMNGDAHYIDAVMIDDGTGYDPPPLDVLPNDLCENAINLVEQGLSEFDVDLCRAYNDYSAGDPYNACTGWPSYGRDLVYTIYLRAGDLFTATMQGTHDASMWMATDCADLAGTCVVGSDNTINEGLEQIPPTDDPDWVVPADGWYYLIIDGYDVNACSVVTITFFSPTANEDLSWGGLKTLYR